MEGFQIVLDVRRLKNDVNIAKFCQNLTSAGSPALHGKFQCTTRNIATFKLSEILKGERSACEIYHGVSHGLCSVNTRVFFSLSFVLIDAELRFTSFHWGHA